MDRQHIRSSTLCRQPRCPKTFSYFEVSQTFLVFKKLVENFTPFTHFQNIFSVFLFSITKLVSTYVSNYITSFQKLSTLTSLKFFINPKFLYAKVLSKSTKINFKSLIAQICTVIKYFTHDNIYFRYKLKKNQNFWFSKSANFAPKLF